jgi:hypothetical protein
LSKYSTIATLAGWAIAFESAAMEFCLLVKCSVFVAPIYIFLYCNITINNSEKKVIHQMRYFLKFGSTNVIFQLHQKIYKSKSGKF